MPAWHTLRSPLFWVLALASAGACAGTQEPASESGAASSQRWADVVPVAALLLTHAVCTDPAIRACYEMTDAVCVSEVGDAVLFASPPGEERADAATQRAWLTGPGKAAAVAAVDRQPRRKPCGSMGPIADLRVSLIPGSGDTPACVRLADDPTPCGP